MKLRSLEALFYTLLTICVNKADYRSLRILRKLWVINENPLPLIQDEIFEKLYIECKFESRYQIKTREENTLFVDLPNLNLNSIENLPIQEIFNSENAKLQNFLLEQLTLEADLWYGRNEACKSYFKNLYPCSWLINQLK